MAIPLVINGETYSYPQPGDQDWGSDATDWAQAVTVGMLQKAGGLFQLLSELDFGTNYGIKSIYFESRAADAALTGEIRLGNNQQINWRNFENDQDLTLKVNTENVLEFDGTGISVGGDPVQTEITVQDTATIDLSLPASTLSANIVAGSITNSLISASAAISYSKLALTSSIVNADISGSAAIAYSKLNLSGAIVNADINASAAIAYSKLALTGSIVDADISSSAAIANSKLAQMATQTIKGNSTGGSATPSDLTATQVTAMLNNMVGDSGSGGTKGLVPAPASGDSAAGKYLKADGTWAVPPGGGGGGGDVTGPASSTAGQIARFADTTGKLLTATPATISNSDIASNAAIDATKIADGSVTSTEFQYINSLTSNAQTQIDSKMTNPMTTGGDLIYGGASGVPTRLANGTAGYVLTSSGGTSAPTWSAAGTGLAVVQTLTTTGNINSATTLALLSSAGGAYTATVPNASTVSGRVLECQKTTSDFSVITLSGTGLTTTTLNTLGEKVKLVSDGTNWILVDRTIPSSWTTYTPTFSNLGTVATIEIQWIRSGPSLLVRGNFTTGGTLGGSNASMSLPNGLSVSSSANVTAAGVLFPSTTTGPSSKELTALIFNTNTDVFFSFVRSDLTVNPLAPQTGSTAFIASTKYSFGGSINIPITGWNG